MLGQQVSKKDMLTLTKKNYENLAEVKERKNEEKKKEEMKKRLQDAKDLDKKRREMFKKNTI